MLDSQGNNDIDLTDPQNLATIEDVVSRMAVVSMAMDQITQNPNQSSQRTLSGFRQEYEALQQRHAELTQQGLVYDPTKARLLFRQ